MEAPASIRIDVPVEEFGDAYKGQYVRRRQRIGKPILDSLQGTTKMFDGGKPGEKALKAVNKILATIWTDWNLTGDAGPLPKPWENPEAFKALLDSDQDLALWLLDKSYAPIVRLVQPSKN